MRIIVCAINNIAELTEMKISEMTQKDIESLKLDITLDEHCVGCKHLSVEGIALPAQNCAKNWPIWPFTSGMKPNDRPCKEV